MRAVLATIVVVPLLAASCSGSSDQQVESRATTTDRPSDTQTPPRAKRLARGTIAVTSRTTLPTERLPAFRASRITAANYPAGLAAAPDGRLLYSELWGGRIRVVRRDGTLDPKPWADVNRLLRIRWTRYYHGGLSGLAFDPEYAENHFVYAVTQVPSKRTGLPARSLILRFTEVGGRGTAMRILLTVPASIFDNVYSLVFGPDGMLYVPSGFLGRSRPPGTDALRDRRGKILRVTRAGKAPGDNPFGARAPLVWAMGFKNPFDLAFFPGEGYAMASESGTDVHDEVNLVQPGHHYGYPEHEGITTRRGLTPPLFDYGPDRTSPVGIVHYNGGRYRALRGRFLMCENHGRGLLVLRADPKRPGRLEAMTPIVDECTIDIVQMQDGSIVFSDSGAIYRLVQS
jgi:glucose/arabinose dehydrogenase